MSERVELRAHAKLERWLGVGEPHELARFAYLRGLGLVYTAAFASFHWQALALLGERGITPAVRHQAALLQYAGSRAAAFWLEPSLFHFVSPSDGVLRGVGVLGLALSLALLLGVSHGALLIVLWVLYRSIVSAGQIWYGYGWELLLVETGFLAIFMGSWRSLTPRTRVPLALIWLARWIALRVMLGAGLIKIRGDACWRELTCLDYHFETQPLPNPLSVLFHALPHWAHAGGVLFNHLAELVLPLLLLAPRTPRAWAALGMIAFQLTLILSGNLSFLNYLTIVPLLACFDDRQLRRVLPRWLVARSERAEPTRAPARWVAGVLAVALGLLSIPPVLNMLGRGQRMNAAFDPFMLVNSYGAFGSVGRERPQLVIEGSRDGQTWRAYELPYYPGDLARTPGVISPLQPRLDWQLWFAAMSSIEREPWLIALVEKLLEGEPSLRALFARDPFADAPPRFLRILRYRYQLAPLSASDSWTRELSDVYLPPVNLDVLRAYLRQ